MTRSYSRFSIVMETICTILAVGALILMIVCITAYFDERMTGVYRDEGVHSFVPAGYTSVWTENRSGSRRNRRLYPYKNVYKIRYEAVDGSGYAFSDTTEYESTARMIVDDGETVERRVLFHTDEDFRVFVEPKYTAESYVRAQRTKYIIAFALSLAYLLGYGGFMVWQRRDENGGIL